MTDVVTVAPILLAAASFALSIYTLWVTQLRRGQLKMTRPTLVCLKRDSPNERDPSGEPKIFLRTLLFTTAIKGRVIESMFLRVHQPSGTSVFDFWGHTEAGKLTLGSGLFVGPTGASADHHFNPHRGSDFTFGDGSYRVEVFARTVGQRHAQKLMEVAFAVDAPQADALAQEGLAGGLYLYLNADTQGYNGRLEYRD